MDPITGFLINLIIGVILSAASTLLKQAFGSDKKDSGGSRGTAQVGGKVNQSFLMGTIAQPGKLEYPNEHGDVDGVPNIYAVDVHSFGVLPITGIIGMFINGVRAEIPATGAGPMGYPVAIPDDGGVPHFWWKFYDGNQTLADAYLTTAFGSDPDRPWLSDMVGLGVPYLITTARQNESLWTGTPKIMAELQGIKLYDITKDSTKGGSGTQRWAGVIPTPAEQATWAFSDNNAVMIYNIERGIYYDSKKVWGGSATGAQLPYDVWAAAINACNLAISLVEGGTEKQFRAGRRISLNERPADVIKELLIGSNSRISHASDGTVYILVGVPAVADGAFSGGGDEGGDVLATEPLGSIPFPNLDSIINGATATYREPEQAWEDKETAPYYRSDLEDLDDGRQQVEGLDLGTTFSGTQAQRVIKAVIEEGRRFKTHVVALPPEFALYRPLQVLAWTSERFGYIGKLFLITARTRDPFGNVVFGLQEVDPTDHDWVPGTDEKPLNFSPVVPNRPTPQTVSGPDVAPVPGELAFDAFWSPPSVAVDVNFVRITYRLPSDDDSRVTIPIPKPDLLTGSARIPVALSLSNTPIEVQLEYIPGSGRAMVASAWMPVTIANVKLTPADFYPDLEGTLEVLNQGLEWLAQSNKQVRDDLQSVVVRLQDQGNTSEENFQQVRTSLAVTQGLIKADYELLVTTAVGIIDNELVGITSRVETLEVAYADPVSGNEALASGLDAVVVQINDSETGLTALGDIISSVQVSVGEVSAGGAFRVSALASPGGGWSNVGLYAEASDGSLPSVAALLLQAKTDGSSRALLVADNVSVVTAGGVVSAMFETGTAYILKARIHDLDATNIDVDALTATSGFFDNFEATWAQIDNAVVNNFVAATANIGTLTVTRLKIANGAVTDFPSDGGGASAETGNVLFSGATFDAPDGPFIAAGAISGSSGNTGSFLSQFRLRDNATSNIIVVAQAGASLNFAGVIGNLVAGRSYTFQIYMSFSGSGGSNNFDVSSWSTAATIPRK